MRLRHPTAIAMLLAALSGAALRPRPAEGKGGPARAAPSGRAELKEPLSSQHAAGVHLRSVGDALRLGSARFPVAIAKDRLTVATTPDGPPDRAVAPGTAVVFVWQDGGPRRTQLRFERAAGETWSYYVAAARRLKIDDVEILLLDADADGLHGEEGEDAWSLVGSGVALPLPARSVVGRSSVEFGPGGPGGADGTVTLAPLAGSESQLVALARINSARLSQGLAPVRLDPELSEACTEHARYLAANGWSGYTNPHAQDLGPKGASEAGARAASRSVISKNPPEASVRQFLHTYYHRLDLLHPALETIGINADPAGIAVIDVVGARGLPLPEGAFVEPVTIPADGSTALYLDAKTEMPVDPVPAMETRGHPLTALFPGDGLPQGLTGRLVRLGGRKEAKETEVPLLLAAQGDMRDLFGQVPAQPLASPAEYRWDLSWTVEGEPRAASIRFRTR